MHEALDGYVIKGLSHNICFLKELVRHPRFGKGDTSTKFIPQEYPDGFHGVQVRRRILIPFVACCPMPAGGKAKTSERASDAYIYIPPPKQNQTTQLTPQETGHALATAVLMHLMKLDAASTIEGQLKSGDSAGGPMVEDTLFVHLGKGAAARVYEVSVDEASNGTATVVKVTGPGEAGGEEAARVVTIKDIDWELGEPIFRASFDGALRTLQCLGTDTLGWVTYRVTGWPSSGIWRGRRTAHPPPPPPTPPPHAAPRCTTAGRTCP